MIIGSLFSGIGGIELGFEKQGFRTAWFVENDRYAQGILRKHWPDAVIYGDITSIDFKTIPKVEVLAGGFPCQDISIAGLQAGIEGERSGLWKHYKRAVGDIRPRVVFIENVSALIDNGLDVVLADLAEIGYDAEWYCVQAADVGAWHMRERIFILAHPNSYGFMHGQIEKQPAKAWEHAQRQSCPESADVPDADTNGIQLQTDAQRRQSDTYGCNNRLRQQEIHYNTRGWWAAEPGLGRVAHGVPDRMDRIKCLGNAVVPQVAEIFAEALRIKVFNI